MAKFTDLVGTSVHTVVLCPSCNQPMRVVAKGQLKQYLLECWNQSESVQCELYDKVRITVRKGKIVKVTKRV